MDVRGGHGMADPLDSVVDLAPVLEALFDNDPPLLDRAALRDTHAAPEQHFWLLHDIAALLEQAALHGPLLICLGDLHWAAYRLLGSQGSNGPLLECRHYAQPAGWTLTRRRCGVFVRLRHAGRNAAAGRQHSQVGKVLEIHQELPGHIHDVLIR
jgi:hypothetical protein